MIHKLNTIQDLKPQNLKSCNKNKPNANVEKYIVVRVWTIRNSPVGIEVLINSNKTSFVLIFSNQKYSAWRTLICSAGLNQWTNHAFTTHAAILWSKSLKVSVVLTISDGVSQFVLCGKFGHKAMRTFIQKIENACANHKNFIFA